MKQLILNIDNPTIEATLHNLSEKQNKSVEIVAVDLLKRIVEMIKQNSSVELEYRTLNPDKYISKINYSIDENLDDKETKPFETVLDSVEYINSLRKQTWRR